MECLESGKVCANTNKKCKDCLLDECKKTLKLIDEYEMKIEKQKVVKLKIQLKEKCRSCNFLEIIDIDKEKVKCFYMINNKCLLNKWQK